MDFSTKISSVRAYSKNQTNDKNYLADAFESDRGRIIQSAAIRRLQQKTQVFPLENNSAVRSRLTHSLEVQQTGRHIVRTIFKKLGTKAETFGLAGLEREVETLVEMSCLMHDIGNPPFVILAKRRSINGSMLTWTNTCCLLSRTIRCWRCSLNTS